MRIKLKVQPNSGRQEIKKILKKTFGANAKIIRGFTSKTKLVEI
jgi:uncharacterized protein YggU (UPF0235/DUF167 family)